jgi:hypothetical protein
MTTYKRINGNYTVQTLNTGGQVNINTSNVSITGNLSVAGNTTTNLATASFFIGDGRFLTNVNVANVAVSATSISNGFSNVSIPVASGNITFGVNLAGNVVVVSTQGANITTGTASTSNVTGALKVTGGVGVRGNVYADALYSNNAAVLDGNSVINGGTY